MSTQASPHTNLLTGFLKALDFTLEPHESVLWAKRVVAGEDVQAAFYHLAANDVEGLREATRSLSRAGRSEPAAALYLVSDLSLDPDSAKRLADIDVTVTSETQYLNAAVQGERTCRGAIATADSYIPEHEYVSQTLSPGGLPALEHLRNWMASPDAGMLVILGNAGHGKTCLANQLTRDLATQHLHRPSHPVPFLLPLHSHRHVRRFDELVLTHLQDRGIHGFTSAAFAYLINAHRILPVLDGFDELAETGGIQVARDTLRGLISQVEPNAKVLLTSRQAYFRHSGDLSLVGSEAVLCFLDSVTTLRSQILPAAAGCGAKDIRMFGSGSRGEERQDSDVDLVGTLEPGRTLLDLTRSTALREAVLV